VTSAKMVLVKSTSNYVTEESLTESERDWSHTSSTFCSGYSGDGGLMNSLLGLA
jgi:hypothetical protein